METQELNHKDLAIILAILVFIIGLVIVLINIFYIYSNGFNLYEIYKINTPIVSLMSILFVISYLFYRYYFIIDFKNERFLFRGYITKKRRYNFNELQSVNIITKYNYVYIFKFRDSYQIKIDTNELRSMTAYFQMSFKDIIKFFQDNYNVEVKVI